MEAFLAKSSPQAIAMAQMGVIFFRFLFVALCLYLASQALLNLPAFKPYLVQPRSQMLFHTLVIAAAIAIVYYVPLLRIIHAIGLIRSYRVFTWPDIIISGLALGRMSFIWHYLFRWLERRST